MCKGIVHSEAFRTKIGQRRRYFDTFSCAINYFKKEFKIQIDEDELKDYVLNHCVESIEVIVR